MTERQINPHLVHRCFGYYGYYFGIVVARNEPRWTGCCDCVLIEGCRQATRSNGARAFPVQFKDFAQMVEADGYFSAMNDMWAKHGCFDPWDSLIIKNEADGVAGKEAGHSLRNDKDMILPNIGMEEVLGEEAEEDV